MYAEDDLLPLSGLQHLAFCERQWALIHLETQWEENRLTAEGRRMHERVHGTESEQRGLVRVVRGLRLRSLRLGLSGMADVVEFHGADETRAARVYPVEYKRGRPKPNRCDEVQLCAQAMCLEEMLETDIPRGALFYGQPRRRKEVEFDAALRGETEQAAAHMHALFSAGVTPTAHYEKKCENCSLKEVCMPKAVERKENVRHYMNRMLDQLEAEEKNGLDE